MGGKHEGTVLTLVERKTKHCLTCPLEGKRSDGAMIAMIIAFLAVAPATKYSRNLICVLGESRLFSYIIRI